MRTLTILGILFAALAAQAKWDVQPAPGGPKNHLHIQCKSVTGFGYLRLTIHSPIYTKTCGDRAENCHVTGELELNYSNLAVGGYTRGWDSGFKIAGSRYSITTLEIVGNRGFLQFDEAGNFLWIQEGREPAVVFNQCKVVEK